MTTKKEMQTQMAKTAEEIGKATLDRIEEITAEQISAKSDPLDKLRQMAAEHQTVTVKIYRIDEKNLTRSSLFTELPDRSLQDIAGLTPDSLCRHEGGGGLWKVVYQPSDNKGKPVQTSAIRTEGRSQKIGTSDADRDNLDKYTGQPKGGVLPTLSNPFVGYPPPSTPSPIEIIKTIQEGSKGSAEERNNLLGIVVAMMSRQQEAPRDRDSGHSEEVRALRQMNERMMEELRSMREAQAKAQTDSAMDALRTEIRSLHEQMRETQKTSEVKLLEAKIEKLAEKPGTDPAVNLLTAVLGSTREDAKANMGLVLELIKNRPDETDRFAKINDMLMQSTISQIELARQVAQSQGGPSSPIVEILRTLANTAHDFLVTRGESEGEEEEEEEASVHQLPAGTEGAHQLSGYDGGGADPEQPTEEDGEVYDEKKMKAEIQSVIEAWQSGADQIPEEVVMSEEDLDRVLATSSLDTAIRLLVSRKKPVAEVTARILALAEDRHPLAVHWLQHPLPATYQILLHWDQRNPGQNAQGRIVDMVLDVIMHWQWVDAGNDPYGRSQYRPPRAAAGINPHTRGVASQGKSMRSPYGSKVEGAATPEDEEAPNVAD